MERSATRGKPDADQNFLVRAPELSLPKGGGAIRGMGEKFAANPVTGSGTFSIPLPASPGRGGFGPQLSLAYDSGTGNGPFGFGWSLGLPAITRKTDKGLPRYSDETDTFLISGAEDLVPVLDSAGNIRDDAHTVPDYVIRSFRPRIEGLFARIERWTRKNDGDVHWRSISPDNVLSVYGRDAGSRIQDPADARQVFSWLICETRDDEGNAILYDYRAEDHADLNLTQAHEQHRGPATDPSRTANRYIHRIRYGNAKTLLEQGAPRRPRILSQQKIDQTRWMFELEFDYGVANPDQPDLVGPWTCRGDPFSTYRAGFEVRTYRLCRRVLMRHDFPDIGPRHLVRSLDLTYRTTPQDASSSDPGYSFLESATFWSYQRHGGTWHRRQLPPLSLRYTEARIDDRVREVDPPALENVPVGLGSGYRWVDLDGEGLSGILTERAGAWHYKPNLGEGPTGPRFGPARPVARRPSIAALNAGRQQLMDLQGNGELDLVAFDGPLAGFHERDAEVGWKRFIPFERLPNIDWADPNLRFLDLTGDGHADALITELEVFTWYSSLQEKGFGEPQRSAVALDESDGPRVVFADGEQAVYLADMSGDGLTDIVRIRNGQICYWPNLGYGRFGKQVVMDGSPWFDHPDAFSQRRVRLADIDGSGTTDLIYLGRDGARLWFNRSGNTWSAPRDLPFPVATSNVEQIQVADLLGNGTACLVWSSNLPADAGRPLRYLDLMGGTKPHLLTEMRNNLGAVTTIDYEPSTRFYLRDRAVGTPWATRLPFPVHCVQKVTVTDLRRHAVFASTYSYHHGYYDGVEREFRGFGRVEQMDTQRFDEFADANRTSPFVAGDQKLYQPPVKTITWFHTGNATDRERILALFEQEYFESRHASRLTHARFAEHVLPQPAVEAAGPELDGDEWREAMRACKGMALRQEVVELDVRALQDRGEHEPVRIFSAAQHTCHIRRLQPRGPNRHAVFLVTESEAVTYEYDLAVGGIGALEPDPRVAHTLNLRSDDYGRALQSVAVAYPRLGQYDNDPLAPALLTAEQVALIRAVQGERHVAYTESRFTDHLGPDVDNHRLPALCEARTFELTGIDPGPAGRGYLTLDELRRYRLNATLDTQATEAVAQLEYQQQPANGSPHARLVEHAVSRYFKDDLSGPLVFGKAGALGIAYESYKLALSDSLLKDVLKPGPSQDDFASEALAALARAGARNGFLASGYKAGEEVIGPAGAGQWWMRSGVAGFAADAPEHFYLPERYLDPFGNETTLSFDADDLFVESSVDAVGNRTAVLGFDHRVLAPSRFLDANDNVSEVAFDVRGLPVAMGLLGKVAGGAPETGDTVAAHDFDDLNPSPVAVAAFFDSLPLDLTPARDWLGKTTTRFVYHFGETYSLGVPTWGATAAGACSIVREKHERDAAAASVNLQVAFEYSDGAGQAFVKKVQAEPHPAIAGGPLRWIANGKTIVNNKGKPVLQYEPYFSETALGEPDHRFGEPRVAGVSPVMFYDAPGRLVRTELPDGSLSRVEFSPWLARSHDPNDTLLEPGNRWYVEHTAASAEPEDGRAAQLAKLHAGTPAETHFDSLGREVIAVVHNRVPDGTAAPPGARSVADWPWKDERYLTFTKLDAEGKPLWICDARGNLVMQCIAPPKPDHTPLYDRPSPDHGPAYSLPPTAVPAYDIAGNLLFQHSMDGGDRRMVADAAGQPMLAWDYNERKEATSARVRKEHRRFRTEYDALHRPVERYLRVRDEASGAAQEHLVEVFRYGEGRANDKRANLRGQLWQHYDGSGLAQTDAIDLSGKPLTLRRRLAGDIEAPVVDWLGRTLDDPHVVDAAGLDREIFTQRTEYDALGRMTRHYNWHIESPRNSGRSERVAVYLPEYNRRGALAEETLLVRARKVPGDHEEVAGATSKQKAIVRIDYNAKGQKERLDCGNGTVTLYDYDPETFRLRVLRTTRPGYTPRFPMKRGELADARVLQHLHYAYDPAGNITDIHDDAWAPAFFANQRVDAASRYVYDAAYRLVEATGREDGAPAGAPPQVPGPDASVAAFPIKQPGALRNYTQRYRYDSVGNIEQMRHRAGPRGSWTRDYGYAADSNRLTATHTDNPVEAVTYSYDAHGSMLNLGAAPEPFDLRWDWNDMIHTIGLEGGGKAHYAYDIGKQRTRKRIQRNGDDVQDRIYLGGYERFRRRVDGTLAEEIESHHLFEGEERVLFVDDVITARPRGDPARVEPVVTQKTLFRYQHANHLGSVQVETSESAKIISWEEFHPYGTSAYRLMNDAIGAPPRRYRYTGMERDEESGLGQHGARYLRFTIGRWITADPSGTMGGINLYAYCRNNPLSLVDTAGRSPFPMVAGIAETGVPFKVFSGRSRATFKAAEKATAQAIEMADRKVVGQQVRTGKDAVLDAVSALPAAKTAGTKVSHETTTLHTDYYTDVAGELDLQKVGRRLDRKLGQVEKHMRSSGLQEVLHVYLRGNQADRFFEDLQRIIVERAAMRGVPATVAQFRLIKDINLLYKDWKASGSLKALFAVGVGLSVLASSEAQAAGVEKAGTPSGAEPPLPLGPPGSPDLGYEGKLDRQIALFNRLMNATTIEAPVGDDVLDAAMVGAGVKLFADKFRLDMLKAHYLRMPHGAMIDNEPLLLDVNTGALLSLNLSTGILETSAVLTEAGPGFWVGANEVVYQQNGVYKVGRRAP